MGFLQVEFVLGQQWWDWKHFGPFPVSLTPFAPKQYVSDINYKASVG